jgi:glycosyltransferase involved in cell wall biosynthesis
MRVLYLVPPAETPEHITRFSFLDEEIEGLTARGIEAFVPSTLLRRSERRGPAAMLPLHVPRTPGELALASRFVARNVAVAPAAWWMHPRQYLYAARVERQLARMVRQHRIDLIHGHFGGYVGAGGLLASQDTGCPLVVSFRGMDLLLDESLDYGMRMDPFFDRGLRALLSQIDAGTFATEFMRSQALRLGAPTERMVTLPKGVNLSQFQVAEDRIALRASLGITSPMILTVAGLIPRKGVDTIFYALAALRRTHDFCFVICGDGPERGELEQLSADLGLRERTHFVGQVGRAEVPRYFAACDMFVLASRLEAAGNVLLEAAASGRPVVCTDAGGPAEYVRDERTGFVVPVEDVAAIRERVRLLLENPALMEELGRNARLIAERDHAYSRLMADYLAVYGRVLESRGRAEPAGAIDVAARRPRRKVSVRH